MTPLNKYTLKKRSKRGKISYLEIKEILLEIDWEFKKFFYSHYGYFPKYVLSFFYDKDSKTYGEFYAYPWPEIKINTYYFCKGIKEAIDTLLHEYAHYCDYADKGWKFLHETAKHNNNWRKWCRRLGARPYAKVK